MQAELAKNIEEFIPPEGVPIHFTRAKVFTRFFALLIDVFLTTLILFLVVYCIFYTNILSFRASFVLFIFLFYFTRTPYYLISELIWNGQTLGKRIVGIRVINMSGRRLTPYQITARNLMKEIEVLTPITLIFVFRHLSQTDSIILFVWIAVVIIVLLSNRKRQRMGDMIAGTIVVNNPRIVFLPDMAISAPVSKQKQNNFDFKPEHLEFYGRYELQAMEDILRDQTINNNIQDLRTIVMTITNKIGYTEMIKSGEEIAFLAAFYRAQRNHLETLQIFGNRRDNKFYKITEKKDGKAK